MKLNKKYLNYIILLILLIFTFFKTYSLHYNYRFPYHHDEWQHLALSIQAMEEGYNKQYNPYFQEPNPHADLEPGFHLFLSNFFFLTGLDTILDYKYIAAIFSILTGFTIFLCMYRISKKFLIGIISLIVFISLPTNVNILGKNFFIPLTMAMPFMFLFIFYFIVSLKEKDIKKLFFSILVLVLIFFIHPPSFIILIIPAFFELMFNLDFIRQSKKIIKLSLFFAFLFLFFLSVSILWEGSIHATINYLKDLVFFERGWGKLEITFFIPLLYGLINTFFAIIGFVKGYKTNLRFFAVFAFFSLAITSIFNVFGFSFIVPYSRAIHYAMLSMIPLTAHGFHIFLKFSRNQLIVERKFQIDVFNSLAVLLFLFLTLNNHYELDLKYRYYHEVIISEKDYNALIYIKDNIEQNSKFITPYFMTSAVYPVSKHKAISLIPAQMDGGFISENLNFYGYDCDEQYNIIKESEAKYILSRIKQDCSYLNHIYSKDGIFIYKVE